MSQPFGLINIWIGFLSNFIKILTALWIPNISKEQGCISNQSRTCINPRVGETTLKLPKAWPRKALRALSCERVSCRCPPLSFGSSLQVETLHCARDKSTYMLRTLRAVIERSKTQCKATNWEHGLPQGHARNYLCWFSTDLRFFCQILPSTCAACRCNDTPGEILMICAICNTKTELTIIEFALGWIHSCELLAPDCSLSTNKRGISKSLGVSE